MPEEGEIPSHLIEPTPELDGVDLAAIEAEINKKETGLSKRKKEILKRAVPLFLAAASFLSACQGLGPPAIAVEQEPTPPPIVIQVEEKIPAPKEEFLPAVVYEGELRTYEGEAARIIEQAKKDFGVETISPTRWMVDEEAVENLPWGTMDIAIVAEAISQLPPAYRNSKIAPLRVLLLRLPGSISEGSGGEYVWGQRKIHLYTSEAFKPDNQMHGVAGELFGLERDDLRAALDHEYTHAFQEAFPEVLSDWARQTGWIQDSEGKWINENPENLIHYSVSDSSPWEDMAVSASLMLVNPKALSEERKEFFLTNPHFSDWPTVLDYKEQMGEPVSRLE